jgi:hypothetical protein
MELLENAASTRRLESDPGGATPGTSVLLAVEDEGTGIPVRNGNVSSEIRARRGREASGVRGVGIGRRW